MNFLGFFASNPILMLRIGLSLYFENVAYAFCIAATDLRERYGSSPLAPTSPCISASPPAYVAAGSP